MLSDRTVGLEELAAALGRTPAYLRRNWLKLHREQNFPRRIPAGWVWPRRAVEAWLATSGTIARSPAANENEPDAGGDYVAAYARRLLERTGARN